MAVLRESPWYQEILREGEARGKVSGKREGIISSIRINLNLKFGEDGLQLLPQINQIDDEVELNEVFSKIATAQTIEELRQIL
ncbi:hypothetical protein [Anabaena azotica]|nr:hypothetical protein [Anabaena azotica]